MIPSFPPAPSVKRLVQLVLRYLALRSRSRHEILHYVTHKAGPTNQPLIDAVMVKIDYFNILNDTQFAQDFARSQLHRGKGPRYISYALKQKGLEPDLIKATLSTLDPEAINQSAHAALNKILPSWLPQNPFKLKAKAARYLYARGFTPSTLEAVIDENPSLKVK